MRTIMTNLYQFDELTEDAKKNAIDSCRYSVAELADSCDGDDYRATLDKIEETFSIKVKSWEVSSCNYHFRFDVTSSQFSDLAEDEKYLPRYLREVSDRLDKGKYYGHLYRSDSGEWVHKFRHSKVMHDECYPLTGCWCDGAVSEAMKTRFDKVRARWTITDFVDDMLCNFFRNWQDDMENHASDEFVSEELRINEYEFTENGERYY